MGQNVTFFPTPWGINFWIFLNIFQKLLPSYPSPIFYFRLIRLRVRIAVPNEHRTNLVFDNAISIGESISIGGNLS